jgi:hypothetical protein
MHIDREEGCEPRGVTGTTRAASLLVTCTTCGGLHEPECPLALNPVCAACAGR